MSDLSDHPLVADRLARLRDVSCPPQEFRQHVSDIAKLLVLPATAGLATQPVRVETPLQEMTGQKLSRPLVLVPILRAGLGLSDAFHQMIPEASVAHYGMARNEKTLEPEIYLERFPPEMNQAEVIVLDPMLATGGSASAAISGLKERGARFLHFVCLVASPEGLARLKKDHPEVIITCATIDEGLNEQGYIVPGLGDAGDRTFGTL
ncbi:uracil phosphoribosyltransferase [Akkermansiaceae bacterium]|nr:uracil phosphoribosyltransferase [Akkermansiaceae bacterium]MDB4544447.1 uracil phosphoribosyltransferase [Akkermansiaceae bacterium]